MRTVTGRFRRRGLVLPVAHQPAVGAEPHRAVGGLLDRINHLARQSIALAQQRPRAAIETGHAVVRADPQQPVAIQQQAPDAAGQQAALYHRYGRAVGFASERNSPFDVPNQVTPLVAAAMA